VPLSPRSIRVAVLLVVAVGATAMCAAYAAGALSSNIVPATPASPDQQGTPAPVGSYSAAQIASFAAFGRPATAQDTLPAPLSGATSAVGANPALAREVLSDGTGRAYLEPGSNEVCLDLVGANTATRGCSGIVDASKYGVFAITPATGAGTVLTGVAPRGMTTVTIKTDSGASTTITVNSDGAYRVSLDGNPISLLVTGPAGQAAYDFGQTPSPVAPGQ
jgi:hypothetical protein